MTSILKPPLKLMKPQKPASKLIKIKINTITTNSKKDRKQLRKADALYPAIHRFCKTKGIEPFAPRECRRTFKTLAGSIGIPLEMCNRLQGLAMTDVCSVHYDRWVYLPEKRKAMETWIDWLSSTVNISLTESYVMSNESNRFIRLCFI